MANYLRLDKVNANDYITSFVATEPIVNGQFLNIKKLDTEKGQEVIVAEKATEAKRPDVIACTEFIDYGTELHYDITKQELAVGKVGRAYHLVAGQRFAFHKDQIADYSTLVNGDEVTVGANGIGIRKATGVEEVIGVYLGKDYQANVGDLGMVIIK